MIRGQYPAPEETLQFLAALRLQYLGGDHGPAPSPPDMSQVFPMSRLRARVHNSAKAFAPGAGGSLSERSEKKRSSFLEGTLRRSFRSGSLSRQKLEEENSLEAWLREEAAAVRTSVMDKWRKLQGVSQEHAMVKYMALVKEWQGYGSTLFNVEVSPPPPPPPRASSVRGRRTDVQTSASVRRRGVPDGAVAGHQPRGGVGVQARGGVASGGLPLRAHPVLRGAAAQRLQDRGGGPRAALRNADGPWLSWGGWGGRTQLTSALVPPTGHGHRQADEGVHQHDRQEALQQLSVHQQPGQRLVTPQGRTFRPALRPKKLQMFWSSSSWWRSNQHQRTSDSTGPRSLMLCSL